MSPVAWKSRKFKPKCAHQFGADTVAVSDGMALAEMTRVMSLEALKPKVDLR